MKKVFTFSLVALFSLSCFSQVSVELNEIKKGTKMFELKDGHFWGRTGDYSYVIFPLAGISQKDLFHKMLLGLNNVYMDADKVVSKIEYDAITINAYFTTDKSSNCIFIKDRTAYKVLGFKYRLSFKFKDGKIRIDTPIVSAVDYSPTLNDKKMQDNFDVIGPLCSSVGTININVNNIVSKILLSSYDSKTDDNW